MEPPEHNALARRIDAIESRQQIADLVHRYTECVRDRTESEVANLMTDDAWVEIHHGDAFAPGETVLKDRFEGREGILGSFKSVAGLDAVVWPMIHNLRIELEGDHASSRCVMASSVRPHGMQFIGEYHDTFRRTGGKWLFTSRVFIGIGDMDGNTGSDADDAWQVVKVEDIGT